MIREAKRGKGPEARVESVHLSGGKPRDPEALCVGDGKAGGGELKAGEFGDVVRLDETRDDGKLGGAAGHRG